jgi:aarF domain-containing kinase
VCKELHPFNQAIMKAFSNSIITFLVLQQCNENILAFTPISSTVYQPSPYTMTHKLSKTTTVLNSSVSETSNMMNSLRADLAENEDAANIMNALRGQGMNDDDRAAEGVQMRLVDEDLIDDGTGLPYVYDPKVLKEYYSKRPLLVVKRMFQVVSVGGGFFARTILDQILGKGDDPDLEVKRAGELRDLITSLGPFYIKLGQALSIRPDVLSPRSMVELQKLCDKVPSYDSKIAFKTIQRELDRSIDELFSEITPEPVAAASLGQVYKATLRKDGKIVAVKVQR